MLQWPALVSFLRLVDISQAHCSDNIQSEGDAVGGDAEDMSRLHGDGPRNYLPAGGYEQALSLPLHQWRQSRTRPNAEALDYGRLHLDAGKLSSVVLLRHASCQ